MIITSITTAVHITFLKILMLLEIPYHISLVDLSSPVEEKVTYRDMSITTCCIKMCPSIL
jgi:hypothetical protein